MGKVVTSAGLNEFVSSGKFEEVKPDAKPDKPPAEAPALEVKPDKPVADIGAVPEVKAETPPADDYRDDDPEVQAKIDADEKYRKAINRKHAEAKSFKALAEKRAEDAAESERFAEQQFNERRLQQQRADEAERKLAELQAQVKKPEPELKEPDPQKYYDDQKQFKAFEYAKDLATYSAAKAVAEHETKREAERQQQAAAEAEAAARAKVAEARKLHADFDEVMAKSDVRTHNAVLQYMTASDNIGEISYYLAKNPEFVERINKLNPLKAIAEIGKLELTFEKPAEPVKTAAPPVAPVPKVNGAPPPITPLVTTGSGTVQTDPAKMDFKQLRAYERARAAKRH